MVVITTLTSGEISPEVAEQIARLTVQLNPSQAPDPSMEWLQTIVAQPYARVVIARDQREHIVGVLVVAGIAILNGWRGHIEDVVVDQDSRGQGIAHQLLDRAIQIGQEFGWPTITLTSRPSREAANELYKKYGFERVETNVYRYVL